MHDALILCFIDIWYVRLSVEPEAIGYKRNSMVSKGFFPKVLLIGGELREAGCRPALNSRADFVLVPKGDWGQPGEPCPGFVQFEPEVDSPFLFFKIPTKVDP